MNSFLVSASLYGAIFALAGVIAWITSKSIHRSSVFFEETGKDIDLDRASLERRISSRTEELVRAERGRQIELERTARFGELARGLFHDLMNPLTALSLQIERLSGTSSNISESQALSDQAVDMSRRMKSFMDSVTAALKDGSAPAGSVASVRKELDIVCDLLGYTARMSRVKFERDIEDGLTLPIHPVRLHQLLLNLVGNAIEACASCPAEAKKSYRVVITARQNSDRIEIAVSDTGCGMSEEHLRQAFVRRFTTKVNGSGLGLMTIRDIVENELQGTLRIDGARGRGTTVTISTPAPARSS